MPGRFSFKGIRKNKPYYLYMLNLSNGCIYIGITDNLNRRLKEHNSGRGSTVTKYSPPVSVRGTKALGVMTYSQAEYYEDYHTLIAMQQYGYANVRGGHWSMVNNKAIYTALKSQKKQIMKKFNLNVANMGVK